MNRCKRCEGFVPEGAKECPNCRSFSAAWWMAPLALAGAGLTSVTLSACYGMACASTHVILPDGGLTTRADCYRGTYGDDGGTFDCRQPLADGGIPQNDPEWQNLCETYVYTPPDSGTGNPDGGDGG